MNRIWILLSLLGSCVLTACDSTPSNEPTHRVEIAAFDKPERNIDLVDELERYDHKVLIKALPSYDSALAKHITAGQFAMKDGQNPAYLVTFNTDNATIAERLPKLKSELDTAVKNWVAAHVDRRQLFAQTAPQIEQQISTLFAGDVQTFWDNASPILKRSAKPENLTGLANALRKNYGTSPTLAYQNGQYYAKSDSAPFEQMTLFFGLHESSSSTGKIPHGAMIKARLASDGSQWRIISLSDLLPHRQGSS